MQPTGWEPLYLSLWCVNTQAEVQMALTIHLGVEQSNGSKADYFIWLVTTLGGGLWSLWPGTAEGLRDMLWLGAVSSPVEQPPSLGTQEALLTCAMSLQVTEGHRHSGTFTEQPGGIQAHLLLQSIVRQCIKNQIYRALNMESWCELCKNVCGI